MPIYKRLLKYLRPYIGKLVVAGACMLGVAILTASLAYLVKPALDDIFFEKNLNMLMLIPVVVASVYIVKGIEKQWPVFPSHTQGHFI